MQILRRTQIRIGSLLLPAVVAALAWWMPSSGSDALAQGAKSTGKTHIILLRGNESSVYFVPQPGQPVDSTKNLQPPLPLPGPGQDAHRDVASAHFERLVPESPIVDRTERLRNSGPGDESQNGGRVTAAEGHGGDRIDDETIGPAGVAARSGSTTVATKNPFRNSVNEPGIWLTQPALLSNGLPGQDHDPLTNENERSDASDAEPKESAAETEPAPEPVVLEQKNEALQQRSAVAQKTAVVKQDAKREGIPISFAQATTILVGLVLCLVLTLVAILVVPGRLSVQMEPNFHVQLNQPSFSAASAAPVVYPHSANESSKKQTAVVDLAQSSELLGDLGSVYQDEREAKQLQEQQEQAAIMKRIVEDNSTIISPTGIVSR